MSRLSSKIKYLGRVKAHTEIAKKEINQSLGLRPSLVILGVSFSLLGHELLPICDRDAQIFIRLGSEEILFSLFPSDLLLHSPKHEVHFKHPRNVDPVTMIKK